MSSNITLSSATRQNLLSLQGTADLLATTQNRLSTGKKVNSALDNPTNFFTADALSSRSSSLSSLLDGISNGIQTIQAANTGLTKLQGLTDQLKSVAQQALASSNAFTSKATNTSVALAGATASNLLSMGATSVVADQFTNNNTNNASATAGVMTATNVFANGIASVTAGAFAAPANTNTLTLTVGATTGAVTFDGTETTVDLVVARINQSAIAGSTGIVASNSGGSLKLTGPASGADFTFTPSVSGGLGFTTTGGTTGTYSGSTGGANAASTNLNINGTDIAIATGADQATVIGLINAQTAKTGVTASNNGTRIVLTGAADGSAITVTPGTNKSGFAVGANTTTTPAVYSASANTLLVAALGFKSGDNIMVNGQSVGITATDNLGSFAQKVSAATNGTVSASFDNTTKKFNFTAADSNTAVTLTNGSTVTSQVSRLGFSNLTNTFGAGQGPTTAGANPTFTKSPLDGKALTVQVGTGTSVSLTFGSAAGQVSSLTQLNAALAPANAQASIDSLTGKITITSINDNGADDLKVTSASTAFTSGTTSAIIGGDGAAARRNSVASYNNLLNQINQLAGDAGFNGLNLLAGDNLKVVFNERGSSLLSVQGTSVSTSSLGLGPIDTDGFQENAAINKVMTAISSASSQLKSQASSLGSNLAVVQNRQDFTKQIINVLDTGSANLTNADMNEEAANSQALSTRNSLGISALALANQAQQAVLQLLR